MTRGFAAILWIGLFLNPISFAETYYYNNAQSFSYGQSYYLCPHCHRYHPVQNFQRQQPVQRQPTRVIPQPQRQPTPRVQPSKPVDPKAGFKPLSGSKTMFAKNGSMQFWDAKAKRMFPLRLIPSGRIEIRPEYKSQATASPETVNEEGQAYYAHLRETNPRIWNKLVPKLKAIPGGEKVVAAIEKKQKEAEEKAQPKETRAEEKSPEKKSNSDHAEKKDTPTRRRARPVRLDYEDDFKKAEPVKVAEIRSLLGDNKVGALKFSCDNEDYSLTLGFAASGVNERGATEDRLVAKAIEIFRNRRNVNTITPKLSSEIQGGFRVRSSRGPTYIWRSPKPKKGDFVAGSWLLRKKSGSGQTYYACNSYGICCIGNGEDLIEPVEDKKAKEDFAALKEKFAKGQKPQPKRTMALAQSTDPYRAPFQCQLESDPSIRLERKFYLYGLASKKPYIHATIRNPERPELPDGYSEKIASLEEKDGALTGSTEDEGENQTFTIKGTAEEAGDLVMEWEVEEDGKKNKWFCQLDMLPEKFDGIPEKMNDWGVRRRIQGTVKGIESGDKSDEKFLTLETKDGKQHRIKMDSKPGDFLHPNISGYMPGEKGERDKDVPQDYVSWSSPRKGDEVNLGIRIHPNGKLSVDDRQIVDHWLVEPGRETEKASDSARAKAEQKIANIRHSFLMKRNGEARKSYADLLERKPDYMTDEDWKNLYVSMTKNMGEDERPYFTPDNNWGSSLLADYEKTDVADFYRMTAKEVFDYVDSRVEGAESPEDFDHFSYVLDMIDDAKQFPGRKALLEKFMDKAAAKLEAIERKAKQEDRKPTHRETFNYEYSLGHAAWANYAEDYGAANLGRMINVLRAIGGHDARQALVTAVKKATPEQINEHRKGLEGILGWFNSSYDADEKELIEAKLK